MDRNEAANLTDNFISELARLEALNQQIAMLKEQETALRKELFEACFENPVEGTNTFKLHNGYVVKFTHKINRTLDSAALSTVREMLTEKNVNLDDLIRMKPELSVSAYKKLPEDSRKIMDLAITAKPGTPSYEIVLPKNAK